MVVHVIISHPDFCLDGILPVGQNSEQIAVVFYQYSGPMKSVAEV